MSKTIEQIVDDTWAGSLRQHAIEDVKKASEREDVKASFKTHSDDEDSGLNGFLDEWSPTLSQDVAYMVYEFLSQ